MASGIGITLGIVAGAAAIGLTAGLAAPALGIVGATALSSGAVLGVGGLAFSLSTAVAVGTLALGAGMAILQSAATPDPISQVHRQLGTTDDPETPWDWVYGEVIKGAFRAWEGVGGNKDKFSGVDDVLACHACEALIAIQIGDWYLPLVTDPAGDPSANGLGLILNSARTPSPDSSFPSDWYVPVNGSKWHRNDVSTVNAPDVSHIGLKVYYGTQTATDAHMTSIFGAKYSGVARKFIGHTVVHIVFRSNASLGTAGPPPTILYRLRGKKDIQDHNGANPQYRTNCAHIFADYCREQLGIPATDFINLQAAATECDDTTWDPQSTAARYRFDGAIRDDMDIHEALRLISTHMAGGWSERGDKVVLWTGTIKTPWPDGPLTPDDFAGDVTILPPDEDSWANALTPHFVPRTAVDEVGNVMLYGKMEPTKKDVTDSAYVTEDGGVSLKQDIKFQACSLSRRAKFMAWIALKQMRLGASYVRRFKKRAMTLEIGDVVALNDPDWVPNGTLFQVASKSGPDPRDFAVELGLVRYENGIYQPGVTVTEDAIGVVPLNRSSELPLLTGLAAVVLEGSKQVQADGSITVDVQVSWNAVDNLLVVSGGHVRVAWKKTAVSWPQKSTTADGDSVQAVIPGLQQGVAYHIRARVEGVPSAGRTGKPVGLWTSDLSFTPNSGATATSPLRLPGEGENLIEGGTFETPQHDVNFRLIDSRADGTAGRLDNANMTVNFLPTGGVYGPRCIQVIEAPSSEPAGDTWRIDYEPYIPVEHGQIIKVGLAARNLGSVDVLFQLANRFYDADKVFIETQTVTGVLTVSSANSNPKFYKGKTQAPDTARFCRPQIIYKKSSSIFTGTIVVYDGWYADDVPLIVGPPNTTEITVPDSTHTNYGLGNRDVSTQGFLANGQDEIRITGKCRARIEQVSSGTLSAVSNIRIRLVRADFSDPDNVFTVILPLDNIATLAAADHGVGFSTPWVDYMIDVEDAPPAGNYIYRLQNSIDGDTGRCDGFVKYRSLTLRRR